MTTAILRRSGGSVILSIPRAFADSMGVVADSKVNLELRGRTLTVTPSYSIDELVSRITPENSHELIASGERGAEQIEW
jgi:antitoxin component of MazEF toxin-antitoxin module